jgi:hypothetical protein
LTLAQEVLEMRKLMLAAAMLVGVSLLGPAPAGAHSFFSFALGLPGFSVFVADPYPPPVVYPAPVYYAPYYAPAPVIVRHHPPAWGYFKHHERWKHGHYRRAHWD